jgi:hypothetical protein
MRQVLEDVGVDRPDDLRRTTLQRAFREFADAFDGKSAFGTRSASPVGTPFAFSRLREPGETRGKRFIAR